MIKVAIIDRNQLLIDTISTALAAEADIEIVAGTPLWENFIEPAAEADVVVILHERSIELMLQLIRRVREGLPDAAIVVLGAHDDVRSLTRYLAAGADGYTRQVDGTSQLASVIRLVDKGMLVARADLLRPLLNRVDGVAGAAAGEEKPAEANGDR